jgi:hypothetical protein
VPNDVPHDLMQDFILGGEMVIQTARQNADVLGDLAHGGSFKAVLGDALRGR